MALFLARGLLPGVVAACLFLACATPGGSQAFARASSEPMALGARSSTSNGVIAAGPQLSTVAPYAADLNVIAPYSAQLKTIAPYSAELTAIASGQVDIITLGYSTLGAAIENAHLDDLRVVADGFQDGVDDYLSSPYIVRNGSGIKTVEDLKGKVLAVNVVGGAVDLALRAMLREHHMDGTRDVSIIEAAFPAMNAMLLEGKVDLITSVPPFTSPSSSRRVLWMVATRSQPSSIVMWGLWSSTALM